MEISPKKIKSFRDLNAWKEGYKLVLLIYKATKIFHKKNFLALLIKCEERQSQ